MAGNYYNRDRAVANRDASSGLQYPEPSHTMVSEYQQSGIPFVFSKTCADPGSGAGAIATVTLPYVSRWIRIKVTSPGDTRIGFGNYSATGGIRDENFVLASNFPDVPLELKCKKIVFFIANGDTPTITVVAGLTGVRQFPDLDQENLTGITTADAVAFAAPSGTPATGGVHGEVAIFNQENIS